MSKIRKNLNPIYYYISPTTCSCLNEKRIKNKTATTKSQLVKYWYNYARNLLTSSGVVYVFVGENIKNIMVGKFFDF